MDLLVGLEGEGRKGAVPKMKRTHKQAMEAWAKIHGVLLPKWQLQLHPRYQDMP